MSAGRNATTSHSATSGSYNLRISDIAIRTEKPIVSVDVLIGKKRRRDSHWERTNDQVFQTTFTPSLDLPPSHSGFTLRLHYRRDLVSPKSWFSQDISIDAQELRTLADGEGDRREWRRSFGGAEVVIGLSLGSVPNPQTGGAGSHGVGNNDAEQGSGHPLNKDTQLPSMTEEVIKICPRFRILVIGKSGVGKSSVINRAFGINKANVSHVNAGESNIDTEILSDDNDQFVLHDSQGLEPGEEENFGIVKRFIERRNKKPDIKDKLHAIWLCFEIPRAGGRILETGVEEFLKMKTSGKLGQIPVIAVFTKYDLLISRMERATSSAGLSPESLSELTRVNADAFFQKECIGPFESIVQKDVPHLTVSVKKGYENTLSDLIKLTFDRVSEHVAKEASIVSAIAQRVNPGVKIDGSIAVGKLKYWKGLASSVSFPGRTLERCLEVIHNDIVAVWSFEDPHRRLRSKEFKALMSNMVDDMVDRDAPNPNTGIPVGLAMVGTIAGIVSSLAGPAAPIVIPIVGCFVLAKWAYDVYRQTPGTLRRLMAYIIDLTLIMQNLFWLVAIYRVPVSRRLIKIASKAYKESDAMADVHQEVENYVQGAGIIDRMHRDDAIRQMVELIDRYRIDTVEMFKLKDEIGAFDISGDEPWDVPTNDTRGARHQ